MNLLRLLTGSKGPTPERIILELTPEISEKIQRLRERCGITNRNLEIYTNALATLDLVTSLEQQGYRIVAIDDSPPTSSPREPIYLSFNQATPQKLRLVQ